MLMTAFVRVTRRGFLGHMLGVATAGKLFSDAVLVAPTLAELIERHRQANHAWGEACLACDADPTRANMDIENDAAQIDEDAKQALLSYRPQTVQEAGERFAYLFSRSGPWTTFAIHPDDVRIVADSMMMRA